MASKPTVTLTLAGDEKKLTEAFDRVGAASKSMSDKVDDSSRSMRTAGERFEATTERFDTLDTRAMGFRDTLTGLEDGFKGLTDNSDSLLETLLLLGFGIGDLASGFVNFLLPALKSLWTTLVESVIPAVWSFTTALLSNPIFWVVVAIAALVGAFIWLWQNVAGFRDFWIGIWNDITGQVSGAVNWIKSVWNGIPGFFASVGSAIGSAISGAFKGVVNWIVDKLNWLVDLANKVIYGINLVNPFSDIPAIPHIPRMHTGGTVPGPPGSETLAVLQAGERVTSAASADRGATTLTFAGDTNSALAVILQELFNTGQIQVS
jgi:phage-related protein